MNTQQRRLRTARRLAVVLAPLLWLLAFAGQLADKVDPEAQSAGPIGIAALALWALALLVVSVSTQAISGRPNGIPTAVVQCWGVTLLCAVPTFLILGNFGSVFGHILAAQSLVMAVLALVYGTIASIVIATPIAAIVRSRRGDAEVN